MSMSWIIMSSTTPTSTLRNVRGLMRVTSMNRASMPRRDMARMAGLNRSMCPTCVVTPVRRAVSAIRVAVATSFASGFSTRHATPAWRQATATDSWWLVGTATVTAPTGEAPARPLRRAW
jgi:hypothetical protein